MTTAPIKPQIHTGEWPHQSIQPHPCCLPDPRRLACHPAWMNRGLQSQDSFPAARRRRLGSRALLISSPPLSRFAIISSRCHGCRRIHVATSLPCRSSIDHWMLPFLNYICCLVALCYCWRNFSLDSGSHDCATVPLFHHCILNEVST